MIPHVLFLLMLTGIPDTDRDPPDPPSLADSTQIYYARQDTNTLRRVWQASEEPLLDLLCRYRLYPLTRDASYITDLPDALTDATAAELALLSGLWGYRVMEASILKIPAYGSRATRLLEEARALDPHDPFVLLIEGQSLLFRPALFGGNPEAALHRFRILRHRLDGEPHRGISPVEAELWIWYTLLTLNRDQEAHALKASLLANEPPPLYKQFLLNPP